MKKVILILSLLFFSFTYTSFSQTRPPVIKKEPKLFNEHGRQRVDEYFWLGNPKDSNVINVLKAENAYVESYLKNTDALQKKLYDELVARIPGRDESLPVKRNGYWYYSRFEEGKQYPYYLRRKGSMKANEEIILDVPKLAEKHQLFLVRGATVSPDNKKYIYGVDTLGDRRTTLYIKDLETGNLSQEIISNTSGNVAWLNDNKSFYYVVNDPTVRAYKVMHHVIGIDPALDKEIYTERDSTYSVRLSKSKDGKYIFLQSHSTNTTEARYLNANAASTKPVLIQPRIAGLEYYPSYHEGDMFHIYTNKDAKNYKLVQAQIKSPSIANWKDVIPANVKAYLENVEVLKNYFVVQTKENGLNQIKIINRNANKVHNVKFDQNAYVANMSMATDDYASDSIRFNFTSLTTPSTTYLYNLQTKQKKKIKQQKVGDYKPELYATNRIWATAGDGTKVPVSIVYRKDKFRKDGKSPMLLYSYGSYGSNSDPYFNSSVISLLDRGITYAIAHIRGGQELGRNWYEQGRVLSKKNTFTDFIDAAQFLVNEKYTSPDKLFINGGSAGGMLMGAVTNMRPDLFKGVIAEVPWMDVITDMFDPTIPLVSLEYDEWGDPNKKEHYDYLITWSPLDNIKPAKYPAILATAGLNDTQVPYSSPAKWVARIRENNLGNNPVLFNINMGAGHGGESGRFARQKLTALKYAFVLDQLGWNENNNTKKPL